MDTLEQQVRARSTPERARLRAVLCPETQTTATRTDSPQHTASESQTETPLTKSRETQCGEVRPRLCVDVGTSFPGESTNTEMRRQRRWEPGAGGPV
jgi:hypothetical protein